MNDSPAPFDLIASADPGDELQRNIRYQNACGVLILIRTLLGSHDYISIWCELHDDFMCERPSHVFDAYQIKTSRPENGAWRLTHETVRNSIKKFVEHDKTFKGKMGDFYFVSNTECFESTQKKHEGVCPLAFLADIKSFHQDNIPLTQANKASLEDLADYCGCTEDNLVNMLVRLHFVSGPERKSYESVLSHNVIAKLPECSSLSPSQLNRLRDALIDRFFRASSLSTDADSQYWICNDDRDRDNPLLLAKKVSVEGVLIELQDRNSNPTFALTSSIEFGDISIKSSDLSVLEKKFIKEGLAEQIDTTRARAIAAERRLLELAGRLSVEEFDHRFEHLISVVKGVCDDSKILTQGSTPKFGISMYRRVLKELKEISVNRKAHVFREEYECLVGIAGLLTEACHVWWGEEFDLGVEQ